ncbi:MAG: MazG family protein [Lachnospiraceae bacterium]|jgi:MazG family protein|uniref:MazG family protein n=1 Tax=Candidatus Merdisoma sp. JLR.KK011 TaxID=3114299 RepID=UPI0014335113|nr:MazG family protein [Lachnospiraceae bacterium]MCI9252137.1 MazG family protein [Lachnospiraceae bacterium]MCI9623491.1 MazG family protein [Lachnospiraceae bacterium]GFI11665.1 nucleoside triphosphate pyrophosphohydrolase/pyrophosphatase MazG [Lachnospiraceae bacterium]
MEKRYTYQELLEIVAELRSDHGCPWDRKQTHESMIKCLREESEEVIEAIEKRDDENLCEELGDVMLQVLMHSQIAAEENRFTIEDVVDMLAKKLVRRHPHVFGDQKALTAEEGLASWNAVKAREKALRQEKIRENP